ncbi:hypothetical protein [Sulfobacillus thermosulfidooxidans]|uniref:hypothetical protein n=1 Tax=Sulfobacillus thermosulfidooxidans TaxID=28034 RepID=UPI001111CD46|nr:hypothetical protein [Sulfobacillus thermosulfidooxidans]
MKKHAGEYKPTINIRQSPHLIGPALFFVAAWLSICAVGLSLWLRPSQLLENALTTNFTIVTVHMLTLGFLTMTMFGVLYQWLPVVFDVVSASPSFMIAHFLVYGVGLLLFLLGFSAHHAMLLPFGALLMALSIVIFTIFALNRIMSSTRPWDELTWTVCIALFSINLTWIFGLAMVLGLSGLTSYLHLLPEHLNAAWVGWIIMLVLAVQIKLLPMFSLAKMHTLRPWLPIVLALTGWILQFARRWIPTLALPITLIWTLTALVVLWQIYSLSKHHQSPKWDTVFIGVALGWLLWLMAAIELLYDPSLTIALLVLGATTFVFTYQSRIVPFLLSLVMVRQIRHKEFSAFFMAQRFNSHLLPIINASLAFVISALIVWGMMQQIREPIAIAGIVIVFWPLIHVALMGYQIIVQRGFFLSRHRA